MLTYHKDTPITAAVLGQRGCIERSKAELVRRRGGRKRISELAVSAQGAVLQQSLEVLKEGATAKKAWMACGGGAAAVDDAEMAAPCAQARAYMQEMSDIAATDPARLKRIDTYRYSAVEKKAVWPELGDIALFWTSIPTSSVSMAGAFAMMRKMDAAGRAAMLNATTARELKMRVNRSVLTTLLEARLKAFVHD